MTRPVKFIFDLDGTITAEETLPLIANHFNVQEEILELTKETIQGNIPFVESFIKRIGILGQLPTSEISQLLENMKLHSDLYQFVQLNQKRCVVLTENPDCWSSMLLKKIGGETHCSTAIVENNKITKISKIIRKELIVEEYKKRGDKIVYIGDGNNDMEAMRIADIAIIACLNRQPLKSLFPIANYLIFNEKSLCRQLNQLL